MANFTGGFFLQREQSGRVVKRRNPWNHTSIVLSADLWALDLRNYICMNKINGKRFFFTFQEKLVFFSDLTGTEYKIYYEVFLPMSLPILIKSWALELVTSGAWEHLHEFFGTCTSFKIILKEKKPWSTCWREDRTERTANLVKFSKSFRCVA